MKPGIELIAAERHEQIEKHGRTIELDLLQNQNYELAYAADLLCGPPTQEIDCCTDLLVMTILKDWDQSILRKMTAKPYKDRLIIAGALIAAEIDRIQLLEEVNNKNEESNKDTEETTGG
jgi:hypothetical protein